jgi:hypothetical protein
MGLFRRLLAYLASHYLQQLQTLRYGLLGGGCNGPRRWGWDAVALDTPPRRALSKCPVGSAVLDPRRLDGPGVVAEKGPLVSRSPPICLSVAQSLCLWDVSHLMFPETYI